MVGLRSGLAHDCLKRLPWRMWCTMSSQTCDRRQISFSSYSMIETNAERRKAGSMVDRYGDAFQYSELKKRPR